MNVIVATSTTADGDMGFLSPTPRKTRVANITAFLNKNDISIDDTTRVMVSYIGKDYLRYHEVGESEKGNGMLDGNVVIADALITRNLNHALFLPLADCVGMTVFDSSKHILMVSHIGRHSLEQNGAYESIQFLVDTYDCQLDQLKIWLTPAPGQTSYPLYAFDGRDFKDVVFEQLKSAHIPIENITDDPADTTTDTRYYSHSEFLKGNRPDDGRYAVVAMMQE